MKHIRELIISVAISLYLPAGALQNEEVLDDLTSASAKHIRSSVNTPTKTESTSRTHRRVASESSHLSNPHSKENSTSAGNLPAYALRTQAVTEFETPTVVPDNTDFDALVELRKGDTIKAVISQDLVAYPGSKAPVTARILDGKFKGALLLGEASMDPTTKRANVSFSTIRPIKSKDSYSFVGELMASDGIRGLEGEYESSYWTYFWAETLTNTVAGIADAATQKSPTAWGPYVTDPGIGNQLKQGAAIGLSRTADRLGDRVKTAPEITTIKGPLIVQITVLK